MIWLGCVFIGWVFCALVVCCWWIGRGGHWGPPVQGCGGRTGVDLASHAVGNLGPHVEICRYCGGVVRYFIGRAVRPGKASEYLLRDFCPLCKCCLHVRGEEACKHAEDLGKELWEFL